MQGYKKPFSVGAENGLSKCVNTYIRRIKGITQDRRGQVIFLFGNLIMKNELLTDESLDTGLNLKLRKNTLLKDGSLVASVSNKTATVKSTLTSIKNDGTITDTSLMLHHLEVYQAKLIQLLGQGYAVKLLDLGVLRIKHKGKVQNASDAQSISDFTLGFIPSKTALESVKELSVYSIMQIDNSPVIETVADISRKEQDGFVSASQPVKLTGTKLKLGNESGKIYFVPQVDSDGIMQNSTDKQTWIEVGYSKVFRDKPSELNFFAPSNLTSETKYRIRIETFYLGGNAVRSEALVGESEIVQLKE